MLLHVSLTPGFCISDSDSSLMLLILTATSSCELTLAVPYGKQGRQTIDIPWTSSRFRRSWLVVCLPVCLSPGLFGQISQPPPGHVAKNHQMGIQNTVVCRKRERMTSDVGRKWDEKKKGR
jgi:hypothetical protein